MTLAGGGAKRHLEKVCTDRWMHTYGLQNVLVIIDTYLNSQYAVQFAQGMQQGEDIRYNNNVANECTYTYYNNDVLQVY